MRLVLGAVLFVALASCVGSIEDNDGGTADAGTAGTAGGSGGGSAGGVAEGGGSGGGAAEGGGSGGTAGSGGGSLPGGGSGGAGGGSGGGFGGTGGGAVATACFTATQAQEVGRIYTGLSRTCAQCHGAGTNTPLFASQQAFIDLGLSNPTYVVPGQPAQSELIKLLKAVGTRYPKMPLGTLRYADLLDAGQATVAIADVEALIAGMQPCVPDAGVSATATRLHRLSLRQVINALHAQLGLTNADFIANGTKAGQSDTLVVYRPDDALTFIDSYPYNYAVERAYALGGRNALESVKKNDDVTPAFAQNLVQVAPNWCRLSLDKPSPPWMRYATKADGPAASVAVKRNFKHMYLSMLAVDATPQQIDRLYTMVFVPIASPDGGTATAAQIEAAWVGACAALIRHPLWISY